MSILLLGQTGQLGYELQRSLTPLAKLIVLPPQLSYCANLAAVEFLVSKIRQIQPRVIVNAIGYTAVDKAETAVEAAYLLNAVLPAQLAKLTVELDAWLIHYSSDYVFDGSGDLAWLEDDLALPLNQYGSSKLQGEQLIAQHCTKYLIFRTSWLHSARRNNFIKTILQLAQQTDSLSVVADQVGAPTAAALVAQATATALAKLLRQTKAALDLAGVYHLAANGQVSWFEYAKFIVAYANSLELPAKLAVREVVACSSANYITAAKRPLNSRLNTNKFKRQFNLLLPDWQSGVKTTLEQLLID